MLVETVSGYQSQHGLTHTLHVLPSYSHLPLLLVLPPSSPFPSSPSPLLLPLLPLLLSLSLSLPQPALAVFGSSVSSISSPAPTKYQSADSFLLESGKKSNQKAGALGITEARRLASDLSASLQSSYLDSLDALISDILKDPPDALPEEVRGKLKLLEADREKKIKAQALKDQL